MVIEAVSVAVHSVANAISVNWSGSAGGFAGETITFTAFTADSLASITDGTGSFASYLATTDTIQQAW